MTTVEISELGRGDVHIHVDAPQTEKSAGTTMVSSIIEVISKAVMAALGILELIESTPTIIALAVTIAL